MKYYDLRKNWPKVLPHLEHPEVKARLLRDFHKYTMGRWNIKFNVGKVPREFETHDWDRNHRGKIPEFWKYVKHGACHWLVNFALKLAMLTEPEESWRIITSPQHSTVWNGVDMLFDFNFQAMSVSPEECFRLATSVEFGFDSRVRELKPGKWLKVYFAQHCSLEI